MFIYFQLTPFYCIENKRQKHVASTRVTRRRSRRGQAVSPPPSHLEEVLRTPGTAVPISPQISLGNQPNDASVGRESFFEEAGEDVQNTPHTTPSEGMSHPRSEQPMPDAPQVVGSTSGASNAPETNEAQPSDESKASEESNPAFAPDTRLGKFSCTSIFSLCQFNVS